MSGIRVLSRIDDSARSRIIMTEIINMPATWAEMSLAIAAHARAPDPLKYRAA